MTDLPNTPPAWVNGSDAPEKSAIDLGFAEQHRPSTDPGRPAPGRQIAGKEKPGLGRAFPSYKANYLA
ncbi:hypothetical protein D3X12_14200 [Pseudomonas protegens]|uniref:Uncharacterized protein n=1 Tax=Pseudomonas protegens TaxID=380021 RepID=A0ABY2VJA8_9PSED|nr:hypothetical protein [Pseudomonas protegens]AVK73811.1 hypothetical protein CEP86_32385 [Pseudomonas protegens]QEZ51781.1 hypothetical protein D3X12_14200 [Pseudomonas protegens]QEZ56145.1 hypothetical protein D4N38_05275 [Pseudomonas protegens]QEZ63039.1 hypothetical protein D4N37_09525 [Pseudomonas protegens]TMM63935.1 hypothetical protein FEF10_11875 [Pseudomonas protegens]